MYVCGGEISVILFFFFSLFLFKANAESRQQPTWPPHYLFCWLLCMCNARCALFIGRRCTNMTSSMDVDEEPAAAGKEAQFFFECEKRKIDR